MRIELFYAEGCHTWKEAVRVLEEALKEKGINEKIEIKKIEGNEDAKKHRFFGSPQININGKDIDPMAEKVGEFKASGCRIYLYEGKMYEYPPKKMIEGALDRLL